MKFKKVLGFMVAALLLVVATPSVFSQAAPWSMAGSFDDLDLSNDGSVSGTYSYSGSNWNMWFDWKQYQPISTISAPAGKLAGTSLSADGADDKAIQVDIQNDYSANSFFNVALPSEADLYGNVRLSFNLYMDKMTGASHAPIQVGMRNAAADMGNLIAFRSSKYIQTTPGGVATDIMAYNLDQWYYVTMDINTVNKTYTLSVNGAVVEDNLPLSKQDFCFPGDPAADSESSLVKEIRFFVNNGANSTGSTVLIDDLSIEKMESFEISNVYFSASEESSVAIGSLKEDASTLCANVKYIADSTMTSQRNVNVLVAMFGEKLERVWRTQQVVTVPGQTVIDTIKLPIDLPSDISGRKFKLFVWGDLSSIMPLASGVELQVGRETLDDYTILCNENFNEGKTLAEYGMSITNGGTYTSTGVVDADDATQGKALKIELKQTGSSSYPFLTIPFDFTGLDPNGITGKFVIDYKMLPVELSTAIRKLCYKDENTSAVKTFMNFRPTGSIQNNASQQIGTYAAGSWLRYQIVVDMGTGLYDVYLNREKIGSGDVAATNGRIKNLRFTLENKNGSTTDPSITYIDDVKVYLGDKIMPEYLD